jgi:hypothetical protein
MAILLSAVVLVVLVAFDAVGVEKASIFGRR